METEAPERDALPGGRAIRRRRVLVWALLVPVLVLAAVVAAGAFVGGRALAAKDSLERAEVLVTRLQDAVAADPRSAPALADRLVRETASARTDAEGVLWRMGEGVPVLGRNLSVVRELAAVVDDVARGAVQPLAEAGASVEALAPEDGSVDVAEVGRLADAIVAADSVLREARDTVEHLDASGTIAEVAAARDRLGTLLTSAAETAEPLARSAPLLVPMLGGDGPRSYLLLFQNPAEAVPLGGNPAAMLLLTAAEGRIEVTAQASSRDFGRYQGSPIPLDPNLTVVYNPMFPQTVMDIGGRPHFPTMAALAKGYWERDLGGSIDAVVSFDPVALADLLAVTGPIQLPTGDLLTADNAVALLLYEAYARYPDPADQDAFFASAAQAIFERLTSGGVAVGPLLESLTEAADEGRLMAWSTREAEQAAVERTSLAGILPSDNAESTTVGVYFDDTSVSKLDFFLDTAVTACTADAVRVTYRLSSRLTEQQARLLPSYVASGWLPRGQIGTDVYVVGPPGTSFLDWATAEPGLDTRLQSAGTDEGRPVVRLTTYLGPEGAATVTVRFTTPRGPVGPLSVRTTPMVNPTTVAVTEPPCG